MGVGEIIPKENFVKLQFVTQTGGKINVYLFN